MAYTSYSLDPSRLGIYAEPLDRSHPDRMRPLKASEVMGRRKDIRAAINGAMFDYCPTSPHNYPQATCYSAVYRLRDKKHRDLDVVGTHPSDGITIAVVDGRASFATGNTVPAGATIAAQLWPPMLVNGHDVTNQQLNTDRVWRSAMGIDRSGKIVFAITQNSMTGMAAEMLAHGVVNAGYTDGGGSARLAVRGRPEIGHSENRKVGLWFVDEDPPSLFRRNPKTVVGVTAGLVVVTLGAVAYGATR